MKLTPGQIGGAVAIGIGMRLARGGEIHYGGWGDGVLFVAFCLLLLWIFWPSRRDGVEAGSHQEAGDSVSFRVGQALNRVRRRLRRAS